MSQLPLVVRLEADRDLAKACAWYNKKRPGLGNEFLVDAANTFQRLQESPELFAAEYRGVRRCKLRRFQYVVYYRVRSNFLQIIGVLHGSRDPRIWQARARKTDPENE